MSNLQTPVVSRLISSGLVAEQQAAEYAMLAGEPFDEDRLLQLSIHRGLLTEWQATQIKAGRERGFVFDRYKLLEPIGAGAMGQVFRALDTQLGREVAVKVLPKRLATRRAIERFRREGTAALRIQHENLVQTFELALAETVNNRPTADLQELYEAHLCRMGESEILIQ